jgi:hypothetical protein
MRGFFVANNLAVFFLFVDSQFFSDRKTPKRRGVRLDEDSVGSLWALALFPFLFSLLNAFLFNSRAGLLIAS